MIKSGFKITPENVDYLIGGAAAIKADEHKSRVIKNLYFEGNKVSQQTKERLKKIWW